MTEWAIFLIATYFTCELFTFAMCRETAYLGGFVRKLGRVLCRCGLHSWWWMQFQWSNPYVACRRCGKERP